MLKIKITENSEVYKFRQWMINNIGNEGVDWWASPMKPLKRNYPTEPYQYSMDLFFCNDAHELFCQMATTGRYFTRWKEEAS